MIGPAPGQPPRSARPQAPDGTQRPRTGAAERAGAGRAVQVAARKLAHDRVVAVVKVGRLALPHDSALRGGGGGSVGGRMGSACGHTGSCGLVGTGLCIGERWQEGPGLGWGGATNERVA